MLQDKTCVTCKLDFKGGPASCYCPSCRADRMKQAKIDYLIRKRLGSVRQIGSDDKCVQCSETYTINSGMQRFCEKCQPLHTLEHDRKTALPFYHTNKDQINPIRNERRKKGNRNCDWCGKEYPTRSGDPKTCGDPECKRLLKNKKWNELYSNKVKKQ